MAENDIMIHHVELLSVSSGRITNGSEDGQRLGAPVGAKKGTWVTSERGGKGAKWVLWEELRLKVEATRSPERPSDSSSLAMATE